MSEWMKVTDVFYMREYGPIKGVVYQHNNGRWTWRIRTNDLNNRSVLDIGRVRFFSHAEAQSACDAAFLRFAAAVKGAAEGYNT